MEVAGRGRLVAQSGGLTLGSVLHLVIADFTCPVPVPVPRPTLTLVVWILWPTETARLPSGHIRAGSADNGLFDPRTSVVRGSHRPIRDARPQSPQRVRSQNPRRKTADRRSQVRCLWFQLLVGAGSINSRVIKSNLSLHRWCTAAQVQPTGPLCTYTYTRLTALYPGLPGSAGTRKVQPIWILLKQETVSGSGISWAICKSAPRSRQITTPAPHHSFFYRPDALPAAQPTASKHWIYNTYTYRHLRATSCCRTDASQLILTE